MWAVRQSTSLSTFRTDDIHYNEPEWMNLRMCGIEPTNCQLWDVVSSCHSHAVIFMWDTVNLWCGHTGLRFNRGLTLVSRMVLSWIGKSVGISIYFQFNRSRENRLTFGLTCWSRCLLWESICLTWWTSWASPCSSPSGCSRSPRISQLIITKRFDPKGLIVKEIQKSWGRGSVTVIRGRRWTCSRLILRNWM